MIGRTTERKNGCINKMPRRIVVEKRREKEESRENHEKFHLVQVKYVLLCGAEISVLGHCFSNDVFKEGLDYETRTLFTNQC